MAQRKPARTTRRRPARRGVRAQLRAIGLRILGLPPETPRRVRNEMGLIGIDVAGGRPRRRAIGMLSTLAAVLVLALGVSALRIDILRIRYALGEAIAEEQRLLDEQRSLTAEMRRLRDPVQLSERARRLGFVRPDQLIDLPAAGAPARFEAGAILADRGAVAPGGLRRP